MVPSASGTRTQATSGPAGSLDPGGPRGRSPIGNDVTFVRTPKVGSTSLRRYRQKLDWTPIIELAFAAYFVIGVGWIIDQHYWASLPFMALFGAGFGYVGLMSLREA